MMLPGYSKQINLPPKPELEFTNNYNNLFELEIKYSNVLCNEDFELVKELLSKIDIKDNGENKVISLYFNSMLNNELTDIAYEYFRSIKYIELEIHLHSRTGDIYKTYHVKSDKVLIDESIYLDYAESKLLQIKVDVECNNENFMIKT